MTEFNFKLKSVISEFPKISVDNIKLEYFSGVLSFDLVEKN